MALPPNGCPCRARQADRIQGDLTVPLLGVERIVEVKVRARGFAQLYDWLADRDMLVVRADRKEPLVILPIQLAIQIARAAERAKDIL